eukprot:scaffold1160_cov174-Ochromonas_danica.AAC.34
MSEVKEVTGVKKISRQSFSTLQRAAILVNEQYSKIRFAYLARAFRVWRKELPLALKYEETLRILRERTQMLETIRSSYLKDVINVKYHLDQLMKVKIKDESLEVWQRQAYDLHTVPSIDLRELINKAKNCLSQSSTTIRDNLIDCGLLDPETCRVLNPWEKSLSYRRLERARKGPSHRFPSGGQSMQLAAPSQHRLFSYFCKDCCGLASLVRGWNEDVEKCMKFYAEHTQVDNEILEFKRLIRSLEEIIEAKEKEVVELSRKNVLLEGASQWFDKWSQSQAYLAMQEELHECQRQGRELIAMAKEDRESMLWNVESRHQDQLEEAWNEVRRMEDQLQRIQIERDIETKKRLQLNQEMQNLFAEKQLLRSEMDNMNLKTLKENSQVEELEKRIDQLNRLNSELSSSLSSKEHIIEDLRHQLHDEVESLSRQVSALASDYEVKEQECDRLRDDLRNQTVSSICTV